MKKTGFDSLPPSCQGLAAFCCSVVTPSDAARNVAVMQREWRFTEEEVRAAVAASMSFAETLRKLRLCPTGGNWKTLRRYAAERGIPTDHFDPYASSRGPRSRIPLDRILVERSTYSRNHLKERLYDAGLKLPVCELCGQGEEWLGRRLAMILDHINGIRDDNRIENLRIVCPNCAATLDMRTQEPDGDSALSAMRDRVPTSLLSSEVLLAVLRAPSSTPEGPPAIGLDGLPTSARTAASRDCRDELVRRRPEVRRVGQRGAQVGSVLRTPAADDGLSARSSTMPPDARPDRGPDRRG